jgi:hypothetical protein
MVHVLEVAIVDEISLQNRRGRLSSMPLGGYEID